MSEYIKKSEALSKANYYETGLTTGFEYVTTKDLNSLPTYHIAEMATSGEYIRKADMERILYSTNNAVRIGEEFLELPTYAIPDSAENKGEWIPVSERLPEESKNYLVVIRERFNKDHWWIDICDIDTDGFAKTWNVREPYYVEAWQPLPEPYKKGE